MKEHEDEQVKKPKTDWSNWCRHANHPASCSCEYPDPDEIVPMRGALPGTRPMPRDK